jgi:ABC-type cobalamin/Fe3+-siderophores transport system ATPase subunit
VLRTPTLELRDNEHCALIGPGVSGKSTLLHIPAGNLSPSEGAVRVGGKTLYLAIGCDGQRRGQRDGLVPQKLDLLADDPFGLYYRLTDAQLSGAQK